MHELKITKLKLTTASFNSAIFSDATLQFNVPFIQNFGCLFHMPVI